MHTGDWHPLRWGVHYKIWVVSRIWYYRYSVMLAPACQPARVPYSEAVRSNVLDVLPSRPVCGSPFSFS